MQLPIVDFWGWCIFLNMGYLWNALVRPQLSQPGWSHRWPCCTPTCWTQTPCSLQNPGHIWAPRWVCWSSRSGTWSCPQWRHSLHINVQTSLFRYIFLNKDGFKFCPGFVCAIFLTIVSFEANWSVLQPDQIKQSVHSSLLFSSLNSPSSLKGEIFVLGIKTNKKKCLYSSIA